MKFWRAWTTGTLAVLIAVGAAVEARAAVVEFVKDGDTVVLTDGEEVRLLGIDTPEHNRRCGAQPYYLAAKNALTELVEGRAVQLTRSVKLVDNYGRSLAYLALMDGTDVQLVMLQRGLAMATAYPPDLARLEKYLAVEGAAKRARRGIWSHAQFAPQKIASDKLRHCPGRVTGKVTHVNPRDKYVKITVDDVFTIEIFHVFWKKYWRNINARDLIGQCVVAQGRIKAKNKKMTVRHPAMLTISQCGAAQ